MCSRGGYSQYSTYHADAYIDEANTILNKNFQGIYNIFYAYIYIYICRYIYICIYYICIYNKMYVKIC